MPDTVEQPAVITERTRFSWPILVALMTVAIAAAGGVATATEARDCCAAGTVALHAQELRIQRTEDGLASTAEALKEIKDELREINRKLDEARRAR